MKLVTREFRSDMNKATRQTMNPAWKQIVSEHVAGTSSFVSAMLNNNVRVAAGNPPLLMAAGSKRGIGATKRLTPGEHFYLAEFGARSNAYSSYARKSKNGGTHRVKRRTRTGLPVRVTSGRAIYPAAAEWIPRAASLWVQLFVKKVYDAAEGK